MSSQRRTPRPCTEVAQAAHRTETTAPPSGAGEPQREASSVAPKDDSVAAQAHEVAAHATVHGRARGAQAAEVDAVEVRRQKIEHVVVDVG